MNPMTMWQYNMTMSSIIMLLGSLEIVGLITLATDHVLNGIGIFLCGLILLLVSAIGYVETMYDMAAECLEKIQDEICMFTHGDKV